MNETSPDAKEPAARKRRRRRKLGGIRWLPSGKAQVRVRGMTPDGVPFNLEQTVAEHLADMTLAKFREQGEQYRAGLLVPEQVVTLDEWRKRWLAKRSVSADTKRWTDEQKSSWTMLRRLHKLPLQALTADVIAKWVAAVRFTGEGRAPDGKAGLGYVRHCFELLRRLVQAAVDDRVIARCPWGSKNPGSIPTYARARNQRRTLESDEVAALLAAAQRSEAPDLYLRYRTLLQSGARPHELARARIEWLLPVESQPALPQVPGAGVLKLPAAKGGKAHVAPLDPELHLMLRAHVIGLAPSARATGLLFPVFVKKRWRARGQFITPKVFARLRTQAGVDPSLVSYQARHTRLSDEANRGGGARAAQAIAGHQSVQTTETYLSRAHDSITAAAFRVSPTLAVALRSSTQNQKPDDEPPDPPGGKGGKKNGANKDPLHVASVLRDSRKPRSAKAQALSGARSGHVSGRVTPRARSYPGNENPNSVSILGAALTTAESLTEVQGTPIECADLVPCRDHALTMPAESRISLVSSRVQREGAAVVGAELLAALTPLDAAAFARELIEQVAVERVLSADDRAALLELAAVVRDGALVHLVPTVPFRSVSRVAAGGCEADPVRFT